MNKIPQFSGKIYPDKSLSIGVVPPKKACLDDILYEKDCAENWDSYRDSKLKYGKRVYYDTAFLSRKPDCDRFIKGQQSSRKLRRYGSKGISKYGKKNLSCFGALMQGKYPLARLGFGTATIPRYSDAVLRAIGQQWGEITRRFFQKLRRYCLKKGVEFVYYGCTEIQEKRFKSYGVPVPHLHFGYVCRDSSDSEFYFKPRIVRQFWKESVEESLRRVGVTPVQRYVNWRASIDTQVVKKSISAYMSKYLSKGCKCVEEMVDKGFESCMPKQWWFACMQLKEWLKEETIILSQKDCYSYFYQIEQYLYTNEVSWCNFVDVEVSPGEYRIFGLVGRLSKEAYLLKRGQYAKN